jgi:hypothetical protein
LADYNHILLNTPVFFRVFVKPIEGKTLFLPGKSGNKELCTENIGAFRWYFDGSSLNFIIEEIISLGACKILIDRNTDISRNSQLCKNLDMSEYINKLPEFLRKRIDIISDDTVWKQSEVFLAPIAEEFSIEITQPRITNKGRYTQINIREF